MIGAGSAGGRLTWSVTLLAAVLLAPTSVIAQPAAQRTAFLDWDRPADANDCISQQALEAAVVARVGSPVFVAKDKADVIIEGGVERMPKAASGWHAEINFSTNDGAALGTREIESKDPSCSSINEALVLVISVLVHPSVMLGLSSPAPPAKAPIPETPLPDPPKPPAIAPKPTAQPPPPARPTIQSPAARWRYDAQGGMISALGLLPGAGAGLLLRSTLTPPRFWGVQVDGAYWFSRKVRTNMGGSDISLAYVGVALCPLEWRPRVVRLNACAGLKVGRVQAQGFGFDVNIHRNSALVNPTLEGQVRFRPAGPFVISLGLGLGVPLLRTRLFVREPDGSSHDLFRISPVIGALDAGIGIEVP